MPYRSFKDGPFDLFYNRSRINFCNSIDFRKKGKIAYIEAKLGYFANNPTGSME